MPIIEIKTRKTSETGKSLEDLSTLSNHKKRCKGNLDYKQFLKEFYTILACRSVKSSAMNNSNLNESSDAYILSTKKSKKTNQKQKSRSKDILLDHDEKSETKSTSTLTSASSLHSLNSMSSELLKTLTYEKLKPIEFIAEDFDHDDYIDLSFSSDKKALYQAKLNESESKRSSVVSTSNATNKKQTFNLKSCFFNYDNNDKSLKTSENNDRDRKAITVRENDDTDLESDIDSEFDIEFARPKLYGWLTLT